MIDKQYEARESAQHAADIARISYSDKHAKLYSENVHAVGEYIGHAHQLRKRIKHTGWYAEHHQDALIIGGVARLRTSKGTLYIPVTHCDQWDGAVHHLSDAVKVPRGSDEDAHNDALDDAIGYADECARIEAEHASENAARQQAEDDIECAAQRIHELNRDALALIREIKAQGRQCTKAIGKALRAQLQAMLDERREAFATIATRQADYWTAVQS